MSPCLFYQNTQVTEAWNKIAKSFKCSPIEGGCLWTFGTLRLCDSSAIQCSLKCLNHFLVYVNRHAVPSAQTTCDWWGENDHPKPNGPAKVSSLRKWLSMTWWLLVFSSGWWCCFVLQKGPWEGWVWGTWGICSGCAHQHWRGEGERKFDIDLICSLILNIYNLLY